MKSRVETILIVENNAELREALAGVLQDEGYDTAGVGDGHEALAYMRRMALPSLILLDLMMSGMDGVTFRAQQRQDPALAGVPVVVVTADKRHDASYYAALADDVLLKPFSIDLLLKTVARLAPQDMAALTRAA